MSKISGSDMDAAKLMIDNFISEGIDDNNMALTFDQLAYEGFNPIKLMAILQKRAEAAGIDDATFKKDMRTLSMIGTMRGSKTQEIVKKSADALKTYLEGKIKTYMIVGGKPTSGEDATLLRIAAMLAGPICIALSNKNKNITPTVNPSSVCPDFPRAMCLATFGSLIPDSGLEESEIKILTGAFSEHQYHFDRIINSKTKRYSTKTQIEQYIVIQYNSPIYTNAKRLDILSKSKIIKATTGSKYSINNDHIDAIKLASSLWFARAEF